MKKSEVSIEEELTSLIPLAREYDKQMSTVDYTKYEDNYDIAMMEGSLYSSITSIRDALESLMRMVKNKRS